MIVKVKRSQVVLADRIKCPNCGMSRVHKNGKNGEDEVYYKCLKCEVVNERGERKPYTFKVILTG